jgi:hypothetical protein
MFTKYMRSLSKQDCPLVLSITDTTMDSGKKTVIRRNHLHSVEEVRGSQDIYLRAREIYFRARRQRPVRAASIF